MILALDPGTRDLGWAIVAPHTGRVAELGAVHQEVDPDVAKSTDRAARVHAHGLLWRELLGRHQITAIAAEAASFNPRRFTMAVGLCMSIGALTGAAAVLGLTLYELPPKLWQHAVLGRKPGDRSAVDYAQVERLLAEFIGRTGCAAEQLAVIPAGRRNHALDSVGVGVFAALRPEQATLIGAAI